MITKLVEDSYWKGFFLNLDKLFKMFVRDWLFMAES